MNSLSLLQTSLSALKGSGISNVPIAEIASHYRNIALGYSQVFSKFAVEVCGCESPGDRVKLRKAVWLQTSGMKLEQFVKLPNVSDQLGIIAKAECPVQILSKKSTITREESSPSKIIFASKLLRAHLGINEATVCRGCSKRGRCPFARKVVANTASKTSMGALAKTLFGFSQSCRLYLKDPETYPFVTSAEEMEAALILIEQLTAFLEPSAMERQLKNVPIAERKAVKAIVLRKIKGKEIRDQKRKLVKKSGMPLWMANQLIPATDSDPKTDPPKKQAFKYDLDSEEWVPEEREEELSRSNLKFTNISFSEFPKKIVETKLIDFSADLPLPQRFPEWEQKERKKKKDHFALNKINIDKIKVHNGSEKQQPSKGYVVGESSPGGGIEYIKPQMLRGKTVLDNVSMASKVWETNLQDKIKFIQRVPFEESAKSVGRSFTDPLLSKVLRKQHLVMEQKAQRLVEKVTEEKRFKEWKKRQNVPLPPDPPPTIPHVSENPIRLEEKDGFVSAGSGGLRFPKLPQWDPATTGRTIVLKNKTEKLLSHSGTVTERSRIEYKSLLRPRPL